MTTHLLLLSCCCLILSFEPSSVNCISAPFHLVHPSSSSSSSMHQANSVPNIGHMLRSALSGGQQSSTQDRSDNDEETATAEQVQAFVIADHHPAMTSAASSPPASSPIMSPRSQSPAEGDSVSDSGHPRSSTDSESESGPQSGANGVMMSPAAASMLFNLAQISNSIPASEAAGGTMPYPPPPPAFLRKSPCSGCGCKCE